MFTFCIFMFIYLSCVQSNPKIKKPWDFFKIHVCTLIEVTIDKRLWAKINILQMGKKVIYPTCSPKHCIQHWQEHTVHTQCTAQCTGLPCSGLCKNCDLRGAKLVPRAKGSQISVTAWEFAGYVFGTFLNFLFANFQCAICCGCVQRWELDHYSANVYNGS